MPPTHFHWMQWKPKCKNKQEKYLNKYLPMNHLSYRAETQLKHYIILAYTGQYDPDFICGEFLGRGD